MVADIAPFTFRSSERLKARKQDTDVTVLKSDVIPLLRIDDVLADMRQCAAVHGRTLPDLNRSYLLNVLHGLYSYCERYQLQYMNATRFLNRTVYHLPSTQRETALKDLSQSIGSNIYRAFFRSASVTWTGSQWSELFHLEQNFWVAFYRFGKDSSIGAIRFRNGKRQYCVWEAVRAIHERARTLNVDSTALLRYILRTPVNDPHHFLACLDFRWPKQRGDVAPIAAIKKASWIEALGLRSDVKLSAGTLPLGFALAREHRGAQGSMGDIVEIAPTGRYRVVDGSVYQGEFWFCERRLSWLVIHIDEHKFAKIGADKWYWPARHSDVPSVKELNELDPNGPWSKIWDPKTGRPISPLAGGLKLK